MPRILSRPFYARGTLKVARELLGCVLARRLPGGATLRARIVEVEAYVGEDDKACHARAGRTPRTDVMYGPPGIAYVYLTYGMHYLLNAVTEPEGSPAAVLIRAAEPLEGIEQMKRARGTDDDRLVAAGPARLTQAFGLDLRHNRADLGGPVLWIEEAEPVRERDVARSPRVGCQTAPPPWDQMPWRFYVAESRFVTPGTRGLATSGAPPAPPDPQAPPAPPAPPAARKTRGGNRAAHRR